MKHTTFPKTEISELLMALLSIDSSQKTGVKKTLKILKEWARDHQLYMYAFPETNALLLANHQPKKNQIHINFITHADVVGKGNWDTAFKPEIEGEIVIGRGTVDDKGPLTMTLFLLLQYLQEKKKTLSCLIVGDEETDNEDISTILRQYRDIYNPDFCLVADGGTTNIFDIGQKGNISLEIEVETKGGHSAFEQHGVSAADILLLFITQLKEKVDNSKTDPNFTKTYINISSLKINALPYSMPKNAQCHIQICFSAPQTAKEWQDILKATKKSVSVSDQVYIKVQTLWQTEPHVLKDKKIINLLQIRPGINCLTSGGNNLAKNIFLAGIPAVSHCPADTYMAHCANERISLSALEQGYFDYLAIINKFFKKK